MSLRVVRPVNTPRQDTPVVRRANSRDDLHVLRVESLAALKEFRRQGLAVQYGAVADDPLYARHAGAAIVHLADLHIRRLEDPKDAA